MEVLISPKVRHKSQIEKIMFLTPSFFASLKVFALTALAEQR